MSIGTWQWIGLSLYATSCGILILGSKGIEVFNGTFFTGFVSAVAIIFIGVGINLIREAFIEAKGNDRE